MAKLTQLKSITGLSRKVIQSLETGNERIIDKRPAKSGVAYEYNENEIEVFLLASFFKKCGYSNKDVKAMIDEFYENRKIALSEAIAAMSIKMQQLSKSIQIANNMLNSEISILDIIKIYDSSISYEEIISIFNEIAPLLTKEKLDAFYDSIKEESEALLEYVFDSEEIFTTSPDSFVYSQFSTQIGVFIYSILNKIGCYSITILESILKVGLKEHLNSQFYHILEQSFNEYIETNIELFVEYKQNKIIDDILEKSNKYAYDSDYIQELVQKLYDLSTFDYLFGYDILDDFEFRAKMSTSLIVKNSISAKEFESVSYLSNAYV